MSKFLRAVSHLLQLAGGDRGSRRQQRRFVGLCLRQGTPSARSPACKTLIQALTRARQQHQTDRLHYLAHSWRHTQGLAAHEQIPAMLQNPPSDATRTSARRYRGGARLQRMVEAEPSLVREQAERIPRLERQRRVGGHQHHGRQQDAVQHVLDLWYRT